MEQYISKNSLVAEIESLLDKGRYHEEYDCAYRDGNNGALYALKNKLNTLEVKEVDLDFEQELYKAFGQVKDFTLGMRIAKHFFELGVQQSKKLQSQL